MFGDYRFHPSRILAGAADKTLYNKKGGGSAPAADPRIGEAALEQAATAKEAFNFYKQEYERYRPQMESSQSLADQVQKFMLDSGEKNQQYADDYYKYMHDTFRPLEKNIVNEAQNYDTAGRRETEAGKAVADVHQAFDTQRDTMQRNNERMGINPNSGNAAGLDTMTSNQEAIASAHAANDARNRTEMQGHAMEMDAASLGRNLPSNQLASTQVAGNQMHGAQVADSTGNAEWRAGLSIPGQGYGIKMQGLNNEANILNTQYQNQLSAWQAKQQNSSSMWGGIGQMVGLGASLFMKDGGSVHAGLDMADGGDVNGPGTETSDSIPARLSDGEYVLNAGAVKHLESVGIGIDTLDNINQRGLSDRVSTRGN